MIINFKKKTMKKILKFALSYGIIIGLFACNNDDSLMNTESVLSSNESFTLTAVYNDVTYTVPCKLENGEITYLNEEFSDLYNNEISLIQNLATLAYKDDNGNDVVMYYSSAEELEVKNNITYFQSQSADAAPLTKGTALAGRAILYDDTNYKDRTVVLDINSDTYTAIPHLKPSHSFNDKASSIRIFNLLNPSTHYKPSYADWLAPSTSGSNLRVCLIGFEDDSYRGKVLYCVATYSPSANPNIPETASHQDWKLANLGWNDKITSVRFRIIAVSDIGKTIHPHN